MQWGRWGVEALGDLVPAGSTHLLGFNEPNHQQQANLQPEEAAALWPQLQQVWPLPGSTLLRPQGRGAVQAADKHGLLLGTPAAAPCGAACVLPDPFLWWDRFFTACGGCRFDFLVRTACCPGC